MYRPSLQVLTKLTQYVTLAEKLHGSSDKPLEITKVQIANVESRLAVAISESGEIKVEGRIKDGVPHLTKVGALDVDVSLEGNIILCKQADQPNINVRVGSILDDDNVIISSIRFGRIALRKQAVMVIGVDEKPSKKALKKIAEFRLLRSLFSLLYSLSFGKIFVAKRVEWRLTNN
nr:phosphoglycerate dehydrogenase [Tanacetum cinerariifolium]